MNGEIFKLEELPWSLLESTRALIHHLKAIFIDMKIEKDFNTGIPKSVRFSILKQEEILRFSKGEVTQAETIHYRTKKGIEGGFFCSKIFGCDKDNSCECEKYVGTRYVGITCPNCGVLVTSNKSRRSFFGHIKLVMPAVNQKFLSDSTVKAFFNLSSMQINKLMSHKGYLWPKRDQVSYTFTEK